MSRKVRYPIDRRRAIIAAAAAFSVVVVTAAVLAGFMWQAGGDSSGPRAVIVDQLALTDPDQAFVDDATNQLRAAGYSVDYVPSEAVTVNFYRNLPRRNYQFIILRTHSSGNLPLINGATGQTKDIPSVGLFTNEQYSTETHLADQRAFRLTRDVYGDRPDIPWAYFGVTSDFFRYSAPGQFPGATVLLMGCDGLAANDLAQAFIDKGAAQFISWDAAVTAKHTDDAMQSLLTHLLQGVPPHEAVAQTMAQKGADPVFGAKLVAYP